MKMKQYVRTLAVGAIVTVVSLVSYQTDLDLPPLLGWPLALLFIPGMLIAMIAVGGYGHLMDYRVIAVGNGMFYAALYLCLHTFRKSRRPVRQ
jgi:hypothetical protein